MKKLLLSLLPLTMLLNPASSVITHEMNEVTLPLISYTQNNKQTLQEVKDSNNLETKVNALNLANDSKAALAWSNRHFPTVFNEDIKFITGINKKLRIKYLNRSEYYQPQQNIKLLDDLFLTQASEDINLYANFTPDDFGINSEYFISNPDKIYQSMLKNSRYGIDHGYLLGSLTKNKLNLENNEYIQMKITVPKGTKMMRVGTLLDSKYVLPRESTLHYTLSNFNQKDKTITINALLVDRSELEHETTELENKLNHEMKSLYNTPSNLVKLTPLGLNAGLVLTNSIRVISHTLDSLSSNHILTENLLEKEKLHFTNGLFVHTEALEKLNQYYPAEQWQQVFEQNYDLKHLGLTQSWDDDKGYFSDSDSVITFSHYEPTDNLPQLDVNKTLSSTVIHEIFHYLIDLKDRFKHKELFKDDPIAFETKIKQLKEAEINELVALLNSSYAKSNWEEFICEAFAAKFNPDKEISNRFKQEVPKTNRMLDILFDEAPPSAPNHLKTIEVGGNSATLTFDHSTDNTGVEKYQIYKNGELTKTVLAPKDANDLSYPDPGKHSQNLKVTFDDLEQAKEYEFYVVAVDDAWNESEKSSILKVTTRDVEPPKLTGPLTGQPLVSSAARFSWPPPTDNQKVKEVRLYRRHSSSLLVEYTPSFLTTNETFFIVPEGTNYYTDFTVEKGQSYTYYMTAIDEAGNESEQSNQVIIRTEDKHDEKQNEDRAENITSSQATLNWSGLFGGLNVSGFNIFGWFSGGGGWLFGGMTSVAGSVTSSLVNLTLGMSHHFVIVPIDSQGNPIHAGIQISVDSVDRSSIQTKNSILYQGQEWRKEDNFVHATDEDGKDIPFKDGRITTNGARIDTSKPGVYELTYTFKGIAKRTDSTFTVTVKEDNSSIQTKNSILYQGQKWHQEDNFVHATDEDGNEISFEDERIVTNNASIDTNKPGIYDLTYTFKGIAQNTDSPFSVTVKENKTSIHTKDTVLYVGEAWTKKVNFLSATDADGKTVSFDDPRISVNGTVDTHKPGDYTIVYQFTDKGKTVTSTTNVTVKEDLTSIKTKDSRIYTLQQWTKADNLLYATDADGNEIPADDERIFISRAANTAKPGVYEVIYSLQGKSKTFKDTAIITVVEDQTTLDLKDVTLYTGQTFDPNSPFKNVTDKDGQKLEAKDVEEYYIDEIKTKELDTSKPGTHTIRIAYYDATNNWKYSTRQQITIKEDLSSIVTKDNVVFVGEKWNKQDAFVSATDEDGKSVPYSNGRITTNGAKIDTSKPGVYQLTYTFKGLVKRTDSTFTVTVKEK